MATKKSPPRLGRGLASLIGENAVVAPSVAHRLPITSLRSNPRQPRRLFDEGLLDDLAQSLRVHGVVQPILVRPIEGSDEVEIVAGERRWRAAQRAGLGEVPVVVREVSDAEALEIATIENVQRADLTPLEEAAAYRRLMREFNHTQQTVSALVGRSRAHVANMVRLLTLPESVRDLMESGRLSAGHGRALVGVAEASVVARQIVSRELSVREAEQLIRQTKDQAKKPSSKRGGVAAGDPDVRALERRLSQALGVVVRVTPGAGERGRLSLVYRSLDQLDEIRRRLMQPPRR